MEGMKRFALLLVALALAVRLAVPTGWMPGEKTFQLTLCTGVDTETVWMDSKGKLHNQKPHGGEGGEKQPCAFGGALAFDSSAGFGQHLARVEPFVSAGFARPEVTVGRGLAAPPPPQTGPPILI
jgi:hypothetical protein